MLRYRDAFDNPLAVGDVVIRQQNNCSLSPFQIVEFSERMMYLDYLSFDFVTRNLCYVYDAGQREGNRSARRGIRCDDYDGEGVFWRVIKMPRNYYVAIIERPK